MRTSAGDLNVMVEKKICENVMFPLTLFQIHTSIARRFKQLPFWNWTRKQCAIVLAWTQLGRMRNFLAQIVIIGLTARLLDAFAPENYPDFSHRTRKSGRLFQSSRIVFHGNTTSYCIFLNELKWMKEKATNRSRDCSPYCARMLFVLYPVN